MRFACAILLFTTSVATAGKGFEPYKNARNLCSEHITGNSMHVHWTTWATKDDLATVVAHYEKVIGRKAETGSKGDRNFSDGKDRLMIYSADNNDKFPSCGKSPEAGEKTVVLISKAIR
jgi:hypothetical protein